MFAIREGIYILYEPLISHLFVKLHTFIIIIDMNVYVITLRIRNSIMI